MRIDCHVKRFPGYVELPDFLNILQVRAFQDAYFGDPNEIEKAKKGTKYYVSVDDEKMIPVILQIVKEWHLDNVPEKPTLETIPMTPVDAGHELITWLTTEIYKLYRGETEIPNG